MNDTERAIKEFREMYDRALFLPEKTFKVLDGLLEKSVAKKPLEGGNHLSDDIYNLCHLCSTLVGINYAIDNRTDYCPNCGQAIDWSVEE